MTFKQALAAGLNTWRRAYDAMVGVAKSAFREDRSAKLVFLMAACVLSFGYGIATIQFQIFPYEFLRQSKLAWEAIGMLEDEPYVVGMLGFEADALPTPKISTFSSGAGAEHILITGGPYQYMDECPTFGCMAWITDRQGNVVHSWEVDYDKLKEGIDESIASLDSIEPHPVGLALLPDGSLIFTMHALNTFPYHVGIAKVDVNGEIIWRRLNHSHHWISVGPDGRIYAPYVELKNGLNTVGNTAVELTCRDDVVLDEGIRVMGPDGRTDFEFSILDVFARAGYGGLFYGLRDGCDPAHVNSVQVVTPAIAAQLENASAGDLLVSVRETNTIAILDQQSGAPKYIITGLTAAQHSPVFLPDASVVVFDNLGGEKSKGGARVVRVDLEAAQVETIFPRTGETRLLPFQSVEGGHVSVSPDGGRLLVSSKMQGRTVEMDVESGEPLWVMENTFDLAPYLDRDALSLEITTARFQAYGAYYVGNLDFLAHLD